MDENNFRKILKEALDPINQKLDSHTQILNSHTQKLDSHTQILDSHTQLLNSHTAELKSITEKQNSHSEALVRIESVLNGYADSYKENDRNTRKIEKRVQTLENKAGVNPPPELVLADVS